MGSATLGYDFGFVDGVNPTSELSYLLEETHMTVEELHYSVH